MGREAILLSWLLLCHFGNIADLVLTLYAINNGVEEANPLMAWLLSISPFLFGAVKVLVFSLAIEIIARKYAALLKPIALFYLLIMTWHLSFVYTL